MDYNLKEVCKDIRCDIMTCIGHLGVGHIGGCLSVVEALAVLYFKEMNIDPKQPRMAGRDRFICSTNLPSHCDMNRTVGIDMTTGSLGQGFSCAVGVALGSKLEKDGATIYAMIGDGESQEGQIWEAAMFAAAKKLDNLIAFTDYNKQQIDGTVAEVNDIAPLGDKWAAFGWNVIDVEDGNDVEQVAAAVEHAKLGRDSGKPTMIILNTLKGCGVKWIEELGSGNHNCPVSEEQAEAAIREIRGED